VEGGAGSEMEDGDMQGDMDHDSTPEQSDWAQRKGREQDAWLAVMPQHKTTFYASLCRNVGRAKEETDGVKTRLQVEVDEWIPSPCCVYAATDEDGDGDARPTFSREGDGEVTCYGTNHVFNLILYKLKCSCCLKVVTPTPIDFGYFPSTPTAPQVWFELPLLQQYQRLGQEGLSGTGRVSML